MVRVHDILLAVQSGVATVRDSPRYRIAPLHPCRVSGVHGTGPAVIVDVEHLRLVDRPGAVKVVYLLSCDATESGSASSCRLEASQSSELRAVHAWFTLSSAC